MFKECFSKYRRRLDARRQTSPARKLLGGLVCPQSLIRLFGILKSAREQKFSIDGRRLAGASARVPSRALVLPTAAVHALGHPDFTARDATFLQPDSAEDMRVQFRSAPHTLIPRTIECHYPGYRHVIPSHLPDSVTIPETHRAALTAWLRSVKGRSNTVRLTWERPAHLTLTHRDYDTVGATIEVPVTIEGQLPSTRSVSRTPWKSEPPCA